jgi:hypothetical protein
MDIKKGTQVEFKLGLLSGSQRRSQTGRVTNLFVDPSGLTKVDVQFPDGTTDKGINIHHLQKVG